MTLRGKESPGKAGASPSGGRDAPTNPPTTLDTPHHVSQSTVDGQLPVQLPAGFGRYRLLKVLGEGGMGTVYLAHDSQLDRSVALKIPRFSKSDGPAKLERFYREARSAATLHHPNICPLYEIGEVEGVPYLTMAYIEGKSLADFVVAKPLTPRQTSFLVRKLALALQDAHKRGVIHRDLKPCNIMIDERGEPVIMDFGLARRTRHNDARVTQEGLALGTPAYMPPEQVSGKLEAMGPACDIYSLGVILYELLAGRLPFTGEAMATLSQVLLDEPPPPSQFVSGLDLELQAICLKAMAKNPEARYGSMPELAAALQEYLRGSAIPRTGKLPALRAKFSLVSLKTGKTIALLETFTILGRASECDVVLRHSDVSKRHCRVIIENDQAYVEDLGSVNGTFVNDRRVQRRRLKNGDRLHVASQAFEVRARDQG